MQCLDLGATPFLIPLDFTQLQKTPSIPGPPIIKKKEQVKVTVIKAKVLKPTPPSIKVKPFL